MKKWALLVGVKDGDHGGSFKLNDIHRDVYEMRDLLVDMYGYKLSSIAILIDNGVEEHVQPTRNNILAAIARLIKNVEEGDEVYLQYAGPSVQTPNANTDEEDGFDEWLGPLDGQFITHTDLHDALVCPLPSGSRLVIVLDLYRYELFRRHAMLSDVAPAVSDFHLHALHAGPLRRSGLTDVPSSFTPSSSTAFGLSTRRGAGSPHITRGTTKRLGSLSRLRTKSKWLGGRLRVPTSLYQNINELESEEPHGEPWVLSDSQAMRCESPEAVDVGHRMFDGGFTIEDQDTSVRAEVIRLASCRDAWQEGENGGTTISQLVDILKKNPYLSLKDLSEQVAQLQRAWGKKGREYQYQRRWYLRRTVSLPLLVEPSPALPARSATLGSVNSGSCKKAALLLQVQEGFESMRQMLKAPIPPHLNGRDTMYGFEDPELASSRSLVMK